MHYYQFNIGDYAKATRHLSNLEDLAYRRLMELYYDTEKPLIKDVKKLARLVNMRENHDEVKAVIDDFFYLSDEGYRQNRIEKELAKYRSNGDVSRFNGKKGGRPRKPKNNPVGLQKEPSTNPALTQTKGNQEPLNNNQEPLNNKKTFAEDSTEFRLANFLYQNILKNKPDLKKPNLQNWAKDADLLLRIDKRNIETVKKLITWIQNDDFEMCNVLSISKLRTRFDSLEIKMNKKVSNSGGDEGGLNEWHD